MTNGVFTTSESSAYDDRIELWYHFPKTYLAQVESTVDDFILYYEPRRTTGPSSSTGRQAYFALAQVVGIEKDVNLRDHYYAHLRHFLEFDTPVPFRENKQYFESNLMKQDGSTNKGAFGRSVRLIPAQEFTNIIEAGLSTKPEAWEIGDYTEEAVPESIAHPLVKQLLSRRFRDHAFRKHVRLAYSNTCAVTGLKLINGGGRPEVQAAHIRPVEADGPDTVRNGIALTGTIHWLFDRGLISFDDTYAIMISPQGVPDDLEKFIRPERKLLLPTDRAWRPHSTYLAWHRKYRFKV